MEIPFETSSSAESSSWRLALRCVVLWCVVLPWLALPCLPSLVVHLLFVVQLFIFISSSFAWPLRAPWHTVWPYRLNFLKMCKHGTTNRYASQYVIGSLVLPCLVLSCITFTLTQPYPTRLDLHPNPRIRPKRNRRYNPTLALTLTLTHILTVTLTLTNKAMPRQAQLSRAKV